MRMNEFKEVIRLQHKFRLVFLLLFILLFSIVFTYRFLLNLEEDQAALNSEVMFLALGAMGLILLFFMNRKINLAVNHEGVHYQVKPYHLTGRTIVWDDVKGTKVIRKYGASRSVNLSYLRKHKDYSFGEETALEITMFNNQKLCFPTKKPDALENVLINLNKLGSQDEFKNLL